MIAFWEAHGRHELPWRRTNEAWRILLAEVLLRKTTSGQAAAVYCQIADYSAEEIANLEFEQLAQILKPLGIHYVRAEQLQQIAQAVMDTDGNVLRFDELLR